MHKTLIKLLIFSFFFFTYAYGERINNIEIKGSERISKETIILFGEIDKNEDFDKNKLNVILKNLYKTNFFSDIKLEIKDNVLNIYVVENPIVQSIQLNGIKAKKIKEPILDSLNLKVNSSFIEFLAKKDNDKIVNILKSSGYYFAKVKSNIIENQNNTVTLIYDIDKGKKAKIRKIKFIGDKKFKNRKLLNVIVSEENKFWKFLSDRKLLNQNRINLDNRLLENFYKNKGYYNVKIENSFAEFLDVGKFDLIFNINAGDKYYFNNLKLTIPDDYDRKNFSRIDNLFSKLKNKSYSYNSIEKILDEIELIALNSQYESINASVEENIVENNKLNFSIFITEMKKEYVERINIFGNDITREEVIRNNLKLDEGDTFNDILLNNSVNDLKALNFFKEVKANISQGKSQEHKIIDISVVEKPTGEISAGAGVGTSGGTIGFAVRENNFLGRGIQFSSSLDLTEETIRGKFSVVNPNFKGSDQSLIMGIQSSDTDRMTDFGYKTTKTGFNIGTRFEYYEDFFISPNISSYYESLKTSSAASANLKKQKGTYFDTDFDYYIDYDKRNQKYQTTEGFRSRFNQSIPMISDTNALINGYEFNYWNEVSDGMIGSLSLFGKSINSITSDDVRISERLYLPSDKLRGFERGKVGPIDSNDYVGGNYLSSLNIAATLPKAIPSVQNADFSVFFDAANVWGVDYSSTIDDSNKIRTSAGIAIDWYTPVGPLSFSYAGALTKATTDKTESFRFNLGTTF